MTETQPTPTKLQPALCVAAGEDRFGEHRGLGISTIDFKVSRQMAWSCLGRLCRLIS
jgi:hypothetical protein